MKFNRRSFIRSASLLATCTLSELNAVAAPEISVANSIRKNDEDSWNKVRDLFPLSKDWVYLNNGTLGPSPHSVIEATQKGMMRSDVYGKYHDAKKVRSLLAGFIGANEDEIAMTHNVTEGVNIACWGMPLKWRDEVIMTSHEHVGNALPWLNRMKQDGIIIKAFSPAATAAETLSKVTALITDKTRVIAIPHIPCTQGQVLPVKEICRVAKQKGVFTFIDGAHGPGMLPVDVKDIGCDVYASCGHKWMLGPKGTGFLYVREGFQEKLTPHFVGSGAAGFEINEYAVEISEYYSGAHRYYGGTQNTGLLDGFAASIDFMNKIGVQNVYERVNYLGRYTQERLMSFGNKIELLTPTEEGSYCGVNSFRIKGVDNKGFYSNCMNKHVRVRYVPESNLNCVRISTHIYNSTADIDRLIQEVELAL